MCGFPAGSISYIIVFAHDSSRIFPRVKFQCFHWMEALLLAILFVSKLDTILHLVVTLLNRSAQAAGPGYLSFSVRG